MTEESEKQMGMLGDELLKEVKRFLIDKPGGYQYIRGFVQDAVREKMTRMKETH